MTTLQTLSGSSAEAVAAETGWGPKPRLAEATIREAAQLMGKAFNGNRRAMLDFTEALSTSDFRNAAFEVLDREMLTRYEDLPAVWTGYARRTTVRDFKPKTMVDLLGGLAALDPVPELTEYPARGVSKAYYQMSVTKYGGRFQISWESIINDELGELRDLPGHLAVASRDTESRTAAGLLTDGSGPNDAYFNATAFNRTQAANGTWSGGSSNLLTANPALTTDSLANALQTISQRRDPQNRPIAVSAFALVVPPALEFTARKILDTTEIRITSGSQTVIMGNFLNGKVKLVVDPWLPVLDLGANAATTWYLLPAPESSRPALHVGFLRGHETPDLRVKADAGARVGGGAVAAEDGSFDTDDIQYRVRHVMGGVGTDMIATAASLGTNA
jgi:hypothetical protein